MPAEDFANAVAWNSSAWQTATIVGPVAGGLLYGLSPEIAYATASFMLAGGLLGVVDPQTGAAHARRKADAGDAVRGLWLHPAREGGARRHLARPVRSPSVGCYRTASGSMHATSSSLARGLGMLRAAPGIGAIVVAVWLAGHPIRDHAGIIMLAFVGLFGDIHHRLRHQPSRGSPSSSLRCSAPPTW